MFVAKEVSPAKKINESANLVKKTALILWKIESPR